MATPATVAATTATMTASTATGLATPRRIPQESWRHLATPPLHQRRLETHHLLSRHHSATPSPHRLLQLPTQLLLATPTATPATLPATVPQAAKIPRRQHHLSQATSYSWQCPSHNDTYSSNKDRYSFHKTGRARQHRQLSMASSPNIGQTWQHPQRHQPQRQQTCGGTPVPQRHPPRL